MRGVVPPNRFMVHLAIDEAHAEHAVVHRLAPVTVAEYGLTPTGD